MITTERQAGHVVGLDEPPHDPTDDAGSSRVTPDAIRLGYRLFLDREPEGDNAERLAELIPTLDDLRRYFLNLPEFRCQVAPKRSPSLTGVEPPMAIDGVRGESDLAPLFEHIRATWQRFGETEPHWSVATSKKFLRENLDANRLEFYQSGRWDADRFFGAMDRNGIDPAGLRSCIEIGCGVGRVTPWLAGRFERVVGCDVSGGHLAEARAYFDEQGIGNVLFVHLGSIADFGRLPKADAVFSVVVLQHNPPPVIKAIIEGMIRALNPGGVAFFQVPTYHQGYRFDLASYLAGEATAHETMEMHVLPQATIFELIERERARPVEVLEDTYTCCREGEVSSSFLVQKR
jgi:SAM-dependent methyltransferase